MDRQADAADGRQLSVPLPPVAVTRIGPPPRRPGLGLAELWAARELVGFLALRDLKVRYKQTFFGVAWAVLQPVATAAVFTVVFGRLADLPSDGVPYAPFALAALVPWTFFSSTLTSASTSLVANVGMLTKVYFPRLAMPLASSLAAVVDLLVATGVLLIVSSLFGLLPGVRLLALLPLAVLALVAALGVSVFLAAVNVKYRDVRYVLPFLVQLMLFASPVAYSSREIEGDLRLLYALNPVVGVIDGFRWSVLGTADPALPQVILVSTASAVVILVLAVRFFKRREPSFADVA